MLSDPAQSFLTSTNALRDFRLQLCPDVEFSLRDEPVPFRRSKVTSPSCCCETEMSKFKNQAACVLVRVPLAQCRHNKLFLKIRFG